MATPATDTAPPLWARLSVKLLLTMSAATFRTMFPESNPAWEEGLTKMLSPLPNFCQDLIRQLDAVLPALICSIACLIIVSLMTQKKTAQN